jgi:cation:H+ antiporter
MDTLTAAILVFLTSASFVVLAGVGLARYGDELAEKTGWGTLWVGTLLVSIATSLPELTVNISAVWLEDSPGLALGNVFGADMVNVFILGVVALLFGVRNLFENQGRDTQILVLLGIGMVSLAVVAGAAGDVKLGPTSLGGLLLITMYLAGMRAVYQAGRAGRPAETSPVPRGSARKAWIGFGISAAVVIVAGRYLAASAHSIAELSGISASFIGVLLVSIVTTLPETSVTVAATVRRSYGIVIGNVYGSNAFNVSIVFFADLFYAEGPLLGAMATAHYAAAAAALGLMVMGYAILRSCQSQGLTLARMLAPAIPVVYIGALYFVFILGQRQTL